MLGLHSRQLSIGPMYFFIEDNYEIRKLAITSVSEDKFLQWKLNFILLSMMRPFKWDHL